MFHRSNLLKLLLQRSVILKPKLKTSSILIQVDSSAAIDTGNPFFLFETLQLQLLANTKDLQIHAFSKDLSSELQTYRSNWQRTYLHNC